MAHVSGIIPGQKMIPSQISLSATDNVWQTQPAKDCPCDRKCRLSESACLSLNFFTKEVDEESEHPLLSTKGRGRPLEEPTPWV